MKINAAVTGLNAADNPAPGVAVIRSLREGGWEGRIVGLAYDAYEPGIFDPGLADAVYLLPSPREGDGPLRERLRYIQDRERLDVLLPTLDSELSNFIRLGDELASLGIRTFLPTEDQLGRRAKVNLPILAKETGIRVPESRVIGDLRQAEKAAADIGFPLMAKGLFYEAYRASNFPEVVSAVQWIASRWGYPVILQQAVSGEEYNLTGIGDGEGRLLGPVAMKKIFLTDRGKGWAGLSIINAGLAETAERLVSALRWRGGFELEALLSSEGELHVIEMNPRFPAWIYLAKACGVNLPQAYCDLAMGRAPGLPSSYRAGTMFIHYTTDLVAGVAELEQLLTRKELRH